jgi:hypothetical protein
VSVAPGGLLQVQLKPALSVHFQSGAGPQAAPASASAAIASSCLS